MKRALMFTLLLAGLAQAHVTLTVDTTSADGEPGADGKYSTFALAYAAAPNPQDDDYIINLSGATDDATGVVLNKATLNGATQHTLTIQGNSGGTFDDSKYQLKMGAAQTGIVVSTDYVTLTNLQITGKPDVTQSYNAIVVTGVNSHVTVHNCLIQDFTRTLYAAINCLSGTGTDKVFYNNIFWNCDRGIYLEQTNGTAANNTIIGCVYGFRFTRMAGRTIICKNNIISGSTTADWSFDGTGGTVTTAYNFTSDTTSPDGESYQSKKFVFVGGENYHLNASEFPNYHCVDPSISGLTQDIDGGTRIFWHAGADEVPAPKIKSHGGMLQGAQRRR